MLILQRVPLATFPYPVCGFAKGCPSKKTRRVTIPRASISTPSVTEPRYIELHPVDERLHHEINTEPKWIAFVKKLGIIALLLLCSILPFLKWNQASSVNSGSNFGSQGIAMSVSRQSASYSTRYFHKASVQPAFVGIVAGVAVLAMRKKRLAATLAGSQSIHKEDDAVVLDTPDPVIFALGVASAMVDSLRSESKSARRVSERPDGDPVRHAKSFSSEHKSDRKMDPMRGIFKLKKPVGGRAIRTWVNEEAQSKTQQRPLQSFLKSKTHSENAKYDFLPELMNMDVPETSTILRGAKAPQNSKFDFLLSLFKGNWRASLKEKVPSWDPISLLSMLIERNFTSDPDSQRVIDRLGDFSIPNRYDPLEGLDQISPMIGQQKYDCLPDLLNKSKINGTQEVAEKPLKPLPSVQPSLEDETKRSIEEERAALEERMKKDSIDAERLAEAAEKKAIEEAAAKQAQAKEEREAAEMAKREELKRLEATKASEREQELKRLEREKAAKLELLAKRQAELEALRQEVVKRQKEAEDARLKAMADQKTAEAAAWIRKEMARQKAAKEEAARLEAEQKRKLEEECMRLERADRERITASLLHIEQRLNSASSTIQQSKRIVRSALKAEIEKFRKQRRLETLNAQTNGTPSDYFEGERKVADRLQTTLSEITTELTNVSEEISKLYR